MTVAGPGATIVGLTAGRIVVNTAINAADLIAEFSAGAKVYLERDTTSAFGSPTVVGSTALASGTEQYEFVDTTGTSSSWYRVRVGNSGATSFTDYSLGVQANQTLAYATLDDVRKAMNFDTADTSRDAFLSDLLIDAKDLIDSRCGRTFGRNPQLSGDGTFTFEVRRPGQRMLAGALGHGVDIASVTTLEIGDVDGGTYTAIASGSTGYYLVPGDGPAPWPSEDIELSRLASNYSAFTLGNATVRLTGVLGFLAVPPMVKRASVDLVREWYRRGPQAAAPFDVYEDSFGMLIEPGSPYVKRSWASI